MGVDCSVYDGKKWKSLDRWYVFSEHITDGKKYTKKVILHLLKKLLKEAKYLHLPTDKDYYIDWIQKASKSIKISKSDEFTFYTEDNIPEDLEESYYGGKLYSEKKE